MQVGEVDRPVRRDSRSGVSFEGFSLSVGLDPMVERIALIPGTLTTFRWEPQSHDGRFSTSQYVVCPPFYQSSKGALHAALRFQESTESNLQRYCGHGCRP